MKSRKRIQVLDTVANWESFGEDKKKAKSLSGIVALNCEVKSEIVQKIKSTSQRN